MIVDDRPLCKNDIASPAIKQKGKQSRHGHSLSALHRLQKASHRLAEAVNDSEKVSPSARRRIMDLRAIYRRISPVQRTGSSDS
jgi:hypothetical protein